MICPCHECTCHKANERQIYFCISGQLKWFVEKRMCYISHCGEYRHESVSSFIRQWDVTSLSLFCSDLKPESYVNDDHTTEEELVLLGEWLEDFVMRKFEVVFSSIEYFVHGFHGAVMWVLSTLHGCVVVFFKGLYRGSRNQGFRHPL